MTHIFKPGDRAYCLPKNTWIELENNPDEDSDSAYPLASEGGKMLFTRDGRPHWSDKWAALLPLNPYDPADPLNPQEWRKEKEVRIQTLCPSCGRNTLFIDPFGLLTCSGVGCKDPTSINGPGLLTKDFLQRWPFMLNGRPVKIGDKLVWKVPGNPIIQVKSLKLESSIDSFSVYESGADCYFPSDEFCWPDELPVKKKVAKWAYPICGIPGIITVGFTEEMTLGEARKAYGSGVQMIPGTEREVEP